MIRKALREEKISVETVMPSFHLSQLNQLATNDNALISFMYYTGALTYCPSQDSNPHNIGLLQITNQTARDEFFQQVLQMCTWLQTGQVRQQIYNSIVHLVNTQNLTPLCVAIEKACLRNLRSNNVIHHQESSLVQIFVDAFTFCFNPDSVQLEEQMNLNSKHAIDFVILNTNIAIEFLNVAIWHLVQAPDGKYIDIKDNWDEQTSVSDAIYSLGDNEVLNLRKKAFGLSPVQSIKEILEAKCRKVRKDYAAGLNMKGYNCIFVVLRVGLRKLIVRKITTKKFDQTKPPQIQNAPETPSSHTLLG